MTDARALARRGAGQAFTAARAACVVWALGALPFATPAAASDEITPAERLIFTTDHLHGIAPQTELDYSVLNSDGPSRKAEFVKVLIVSPGNAKGDAQVSDRTGSVTLPVGNLQCNPVIIYFLEHDITEMQQLTGGQRRYFQQRLRLALAAGPKIETVTSQIGGKPVKAQQIVVEPYRDDPNAERFAQYTGKRYTFLLADGVPGQVAQIRAEIPGANGDFGHPLHTETLTFQAALRKLPPPNGRPGTPAKPSDAPRASR
ncbi:hypothetical protein [Paraburkholderia sp.]|uniref:hypothetical protein n=1 Tax=Paraburkholderia sp. TaxID=1926495 RepID=UPI003D6FDA04